MEPLLTQLAQSVSGARDLETLTRPLLELLEAVTHLESTYLTMVDEAQGLQHVLFSRNAKQQMQIPEGIAVPWGDTLCKRALEEGRPYTDDVSACWGDSDAARQLGIKSYVSQPVRYPDGGLYGTLCAASADQVSVTPDTIKVLGIFAQLIAYQVERERTMDALRQSNAELSSHALIDPLTGIANRRALTRELKRMLTRADREHSSLQLAFIDLDGFKAINDHYGHEVGDRFLVHIATRLAGGLRAGDFVARYGGDEFVVAAPNITSDELRTRIETLTGGRYSTDTLTIDYGSASVGIVGAEPGELDAERLLGRADAAMYAVKKARKS